ncbi:MAG TPA: HD domain-containing protein [Myxococcota bacterium]|nr:HD domain-containing protein [Myxococcota bacterium]
MIPPGPETRRRLLEALSLKTLPRAGWERAGVSKPESVAAHSWGVAWLVLVLCPEELDLETALAIAVVHDLAEVRVGDITPHDGIDPREKTRLEREAFADMVDPLPRAERLLALFEAYGDSPEGRFVQVCDKLDMALQAAWYEADDHTLDLSEFVDSALAKLASGKLAELVRSCDEPREP